jgi:hypothetical protein
VPLEVLLDRQRADRRILHPVNAAPVAKLIQGRSDPCLVSVEAGRVDEADTDLAGPELQPIGLGRLCQCREHCDVERRVLGRRSPQRQQPGSLVAIQRRVSERGASFYLLRLVSHASDGS